MRFLAAIAWFPVILAAQNAGIDRQLEAAIHREMVDGDLAGAIAQYRSILGQAPKLRPLAAEALFRMSQCLEKLGQRKEAHVGYTRVASEYGDSEFSAQARAKLAGWTDALPGPRNLRFEQGEPGEVPPGWFVPSVPTGGDRAAELRRKGCRGTGGCVVVLAPASGPQRIGSLMQSFSAAAYRGKTVRLRAWLRLEALAPEDRAQMWLQVVRTNGQSGFFDNMDDRPVRSSHWTKCEIASLIGEDAQFLDFGLSSIGKGRVWADEVSFEIVPQNEVEAARDAVQRLYGRIDAGYRQGAFEDASAFALSDAHSRRYDVKEPFAASVRARFLNFQTSIVSFRLAGTGAVATARSEFVRTMPEGRMSGTRTFRDTWALTAEGWRLKERTGLTSHYSLPATDEQTTRLVAADLRQLASPLATPEAGHTLYDLTPFGNAVAEARVVALGAASEGTQEFFQMKHRLLEYLVKEKGFSAVAVADAPPLVAELDRYIKTGEGDVRASLAKFGSRAWNSQEALELVEWMRAFNQALIPHPTLSFTTLDAHVGTAGKVVLWTDNATIRGTSLRQQFGNRLYAVGFAFRRGELRASGYRNGDPTGVSSYAVPPLPEGAGDTVLSAAGMPLFFLDIRGVEPMTTLGRWLAEPHLFLSVGANWNQDGPENHLRPAVLSKAYDGLIFVEAGHAARRMP